MATGRGKKRAITGMSIVPSPKPEKKVNRDAKSAESAMKRGSTIALCYLKMSGNNPDHRFTGSGKQIEFGKGAMQMVEDDQLSRFACYLIAQNRNQQQSIEDFGEMP